MRKNIIFFILITLIILPPFFDGGRNVFVNEFILIFIGLALLLFWRLNKKEKNQEKENFFLSPLFFLSLFLALSLITVFFSTSPYNSFVVWLQYLGYGILFFIVVKYKFEKKEINILIKTFLGISSILCLIGIFFYLTGGYSRLTSTFYWPNPFAGYLLFSLPLGFYWLFKSEEKFKNKIFPSLLLVLLIASFILTESRGAFISILLVLPVFIYFLYRSIKKNIANILLIIVLSAVLITGINFLKQDSFGFSSRIKMSLTESDWSSSIRFNYWQGTWEIFKDYPLIGSGLGTFGIIYPQYQKDPISAGKYAHNLYLEMLSESGMFVLIVFIAFLASIYWIKFKDLKEKEYVLPLFVGTLAFLIHNGVDVDWHFTANTLTFWIFIGLFYNIYYNQRNYGRNYENIFNKIFSFLSRLRKKGNKRKYGIINILVIFISILLITKGVIFLYSSYNFNNGLRHQETGKLSLAEDYFKKSIFLNPNPEYLRRYGIILYSRGLNSEEKEKLPNEALKIANKTIKLDHLNPLNYELRGKIYYAQGNIEKAEIDFHKTIELNKFKPRYYINLSSLLINQSKISEARETIKEILSYYPDTIVKNREIIIMKDQQITSGIEKEIDYLRYLLELTYKQEVFD